MDEHHTDGKGLAGTAQTEVHLCRLLQHDVCRGRLRTAQRHRVPDRLACRDSRRRCPLRQNRALPVRQWQQPVPQHHRHLLQLLLGRLQGRVFAGRIQCTAVGHRYQVHGPAGQRNTRHTGKLRSREARGYQSQQHSLLLVLRHTSDVRHEGRRQDKRHGRRLQQLGEGLQPGGTLLSYVDEVDDHLLKAGIKFQELHPGRVDVRLRQHVRTPQLVLLQFKYNKTSTSMEWNRAMEWNRFGW